MTIEEGLAVLSETLQGDRCVYIASMNFTEDEVLTVVHCNQERDGHKTPFHLPEHEFMGHQCIAVNAAPLLVAVAKAADELTEALMNREDDSDVVGVIGATANELAAALDALAAGLAE